MEAFSCVCDQGACYIIYMLMIACSGMALVLAGGQP